MNNSKDFSKYQQALEDFLLSKGETKYTHDVMLNVVYEGEGLEPLFFQNTPVLFDFNDYNSNRVFVWELNQAPDNYYEDFRPIFQAFDYDPKQGELVITGSGSYGKYKVTLY